MGWDGMGGISKLSFIFLLGIYIGHACMYSYIDNKKKSPTFLCVSNVDGKLGVGEHNFRNNSVCEFFNIRFQSRLFSFCFYLGLAIFLKILKTFFAIQNGVLKFAFETKVYRVLLSRPKRG